jgi:putative phosphoesterase
MKVALISDIHANLHALEAVLNDAHKRGVEAIWNMGDMLGYGAAPNEVIDILIKENAQSIIGNYDSKVLKVREKKKNWKDGAPPEKWFAYNWTYKNLSKNNREYLSKLPNEIRMEIEGKRILLTHGSPESDEEHLTSETPEERFIDIAGKSNADIIIFGHSHVPFKHKSEKVWFINPGSVGRQGDGDPKASYAILSIKHPNLFRIDFYRVEYDIEKAVEAIHNSGLPELFAQMLLEGKNFEKTKEISEKKAKKTIDDSDKLASSYELAKSCGYESEHAEQVMSIALNIFDELQPIHELDQKERFFLQNSAILHDIGWINGQQKHHKSSLRIILEDKTLLFDERERLIIGSICRYHRAALPKKKHAHYSSLEPSERKVVSLLAGILRVADGLDRTHQNIVKSLKCEVTTDKVIIKCVVSHSSEADRQAALDKGQLLEKVFDRKLSIEWQL